MLHFTANILFIHLLTHSYLNQCIKYRHLFSINNYSTAWTPTGHDEYFYLYLIMFSSWWWQADKYMRISTSLHPPYSQTARKLYTHTYIHICMHACMHVRTHARTHTHTHTHSYIHMHTYPATNTHRHSALYNLLCKLMFQV